MQNFGEEIFLKTTTWKEMGGKREKYTVRMGCR
jgi:hypothetical protein